MADEEQNCSVGGAKTYKTLLGTLFRGRMTDRTKLVAWLPIAVVVALTRLTSAHAAVGDVANLISGGVQGFQNLLALIALALLGAGLALKFLPTGSHRTKDAAGQLIDNALIIGGLAALGLVSFSAMMASMVYTLRRGLW
ncbi:MAG: hypothetical protein QXK69_13140 [Candidatus Caldarchaeum sp.]